ncbi:PDDEXK-like family protein [Treponema sp. R80B11-R83G3]
MLTEVAGVRKRFEEEWRKTGEKYNLFMVAGIAHKEVIMCRVLADLLDPQGKHCQGSRYLSLFWETISPKLPERLELIIKDTKVTAEYVIDENRRIDITLEDGRVFVPIEVKIWAGDQPKQVADYYEFAKKKNNVNVPVLYLTVDGHEPSDFSKAGVGKNNYVPLSFRDDILAWLDACELENTPETTVPVRENLRQLIAAIKSLCGKSEDAKMENEIFELITKNDDSVRAALDISRNMDFNKKVLEEFKEHITKLVQDKFTPPVAVFRPNNGDGWDMIQIEIMGGDYILDVNYDWKSFEIECCIENEKERNPQIEVRMKDEMVNFTKCKNEKNDKVFSICTNRYPFKEPVDEDLYFYRLAKLYTEHPQEVADKIIDIALALEGVKG